MTEYDFSPEAFQAHLDNMNRVSRWVGRTEEHRSQFGNAAALMEEGTNVRQHSPPPEHKTSFGTRRKKIPPPLPLHPFGTPDPMYVPMQSAQHGMGMSPYASPLHSADEGFIYASGLGSPGPMSPHIPGYPGYATPRSAGVQMMMTSPPLMSPPLLSPAPSAPRYYNQSHSRHSPAQSFSLIPPQPLSPGPLMAAAAPLSGGYPQATPNFVILPPTPTKYHRSGRHRGRPEVTYVYV